MTQTKPTKHPKPRKKRERIAVLKSVLIIAAVAFIPVSFGIAIVGAPMIPINPQTLADQHPQTTQSWRKTPEKGCGLNQTTTPKGCDDNHNIKTREEEVSYPSHLTEKGLKTLRATLTIPKHTTTPKPAILLVAGSGPTPRDAITHGDLVYKMDNPFPMMKALADHFAQQGMVVLRFDKRSCVDCYKKDGYGFNPATFRFTDFIEDACDGLNFLSQHPEVDPQRIVIIGHSQGAHHTPAIAECLKKPSKVAAIVMLSGPLRSFRETLLEQFKVMAELRKERFDWITALILEGQYTGYKACLDKLDQEDLYDPDEICIGGGVSQAALKDYLAFSTKVPAQLQRLDIPIFYALGNADRNIQPKALDLMAKALKNNDAELHRINGMNHSLVNALDDPDPTVLDPQLLKALDAFLSSVH